ncbi:MAG: ATP-binding protein [Crenarchaeota archaeon]|nr:ATP-binding protein [Thermoproteota archaeon]
MMNREPIGYVVAAEGAGVLSVALKRINVSRYDYVYYEVTDKVDGRLMNIKVIGQILDIKREPYRLTPESYIADIIESTPHESLIEVLSGKVITLGFRKGDVILKPRSVPPVGSPVYLADDDDVRKLIEVPERRGLHVGYLITRPSIPAFLDVNGLRRHLAIIAATGSGKTWTSVLLIEELLKKGATIVVIDPHGEYVPIKRSIERLGPEYRDAVSVFKIAKYQSGERKYRINVATIDSDTLASLMRIPSNAAKMRHVLVLAHSLVKLLREATGDRRFCTLRNIRRILRAVASGKIKSVSSLATILRPKFDPSILNNIDLKLRRRIESLVNELREFAEDKRNRAVAASVIIRLRKLERLRVYTYFSTPLNKILRPRHITILNLAGVSDEVQDHVVHHVLSRILAARIRYVRGLRGPKYPYPVVVIVEEAHKFAPPRSKERKWSIETLTKIACEGRKFGVYLVIITQRPSRIDPDVLSQCNSQIILRLVNPRDIDAVVQASEVVDSEISRLIPQLNVGEAIITGPVVPMPIIIRLRDRVLDYGGADIDVVAEWSRSVTASDNKLEEFCKIVSMIFDIDVPKVEAEKALLSACMVDRYVIEDGVLSGFVKGAYVEVRLNERSWSCTKCNGVMLTPCSHVMQLLAKAFLDGNLRLGDGIIR